MKLAFNIRIPPSGCWSAAGAEAGSGATALRKTQVERRYDEEVEQGRCEEAAENDDGERVLDLVGGGFSGGDEGHERKGRCQRRHQDRRQAFVRAAQDEAGTEGLTLVLFEMLEVIDHQDAAARGDSEHGVEADKRTEREHPAAEPRCQRSAYQSHRQDQEGQRREAPTPERRLQNEEDPDRGANAEEQQALLGRLSLGVLPEQFRVVLLGELDALKSTFDVAGNRAEVTSVDTGDDVDAP